MVSAFDGATANEDPERRSALVMRNISVHGHRTSIRLEPEIWDGLAEICRREYCTTQDVCSYVADHRHGSLASSLRVFILGYFHTSSTEAGHRNVGHGQGMFLSQQQERWEMRAMKAVRCEPSAVALPPPAPSFAKATDGRGLRQTDRAMADGPDELQPSPQSGRSGPVG
jgi:predicted DNA-binding ribbon-helix-helix protein